MPSNRTYFDANILLELVENRQSYAAAYDAVAGAEHPYISTLSVHIFMYFEYAAYDTKYLIDFLNAFTIADLTQADTMWAFANCRGNDFEDALQIAVALRNGCDEFVTLDKSLAHAYKDLPTLKITLL
jgi:predicted nucleic acid-binding protein